jgi:dTDP-4-amino-4,6-dideoxygalactose transaminase
MQVKYELEVKYGTSYGQEEIDAVVNCIKENAPSCGQRVKDFEKAFAEYCGAKYSLAVTNATTGLTLTGLALGVKAGDEVITTPISWISTATAYAALGAKMVFCDVDPKNMLLDPDKLEALITPKTKAIVPVHLYGRSLELDRIMEIAKKKQVPVIDDCAHNPGGKFKGRSVGSIADMGVFSFHQQKNMATLGEGGMVTTNNKEYFEAMLGYRSLCARMYGKSDKYLSIDEEKYPMNKRYWYLMFDDIGHNFRMTDVQAAAGLVQLKKVDENNRIRTKIAARITDNLKSCPYLVLPEEPGNTEHVWHVYLLMLTPDSPVGKVDFMYELYSQYGIKAWSHYLPIHLQTPFTDRGHKEGECPVAEEAFNRYVTLPVHPRMTDEAVDYMTDCIQKVLRGK